MTAEEKRLQEDREKKAHWRRWGPYLSDRQWGTVREDYSAYGTAWDYFPHDHARSRAYRWGEDGLLGISDNHQRLCFGWAVWNGQDPILKERLFGLTGNEGNHGEDVKEYYFYLDNTPSHAYMKALYKYPQRAFPYADLLHENQRRGRQAPEYELIDTGVFNENRYFDVEIEYAKHTPNDILIRLTITNQGPDDAYLDVLPSLWFRNTWAWGRPSPKPVLRAEKRKEWLIHAHHPEWTDYWLYTEPGADILFTENETNFERVFGSPNRSPYVKDGINDYVVNGRKEKVNPHLTGTKAAARYTMNIPAGQKRVLRLRLADTNDIPNPFGADFDRVIAQRRSEADAFYEQDWNVPADKSKRAADLKNIQRQAYAGLLWSKQFYHYIVSDWLKGDPSAPPPPHERKHGRNKAWEHLYSEDILSMPDKWEYPWYAAWDLAFHAIPLAVVDPEFAKRQLEVLTREWYMHPNGQLPAYEWAFGDVNPPVHAWATWRVYKIDGKRTGKKDRAFLERVFQKLLLNFTWWVNRKDADGRNIFQGGFLGLDNIGVFDRNVELPQGGHLEQSDGTSWMAMYALNMLAIAMELSQENPVYEDIASKFFEHFLYIAQAINGSPDSHADYTEHDDHSEGLWDEKDGFFYDGLHTAQSRQIISLRSLVGLVPLFAVEVLDPKVLRAMPGFFRRYNWFLTNRPDLQANVGCPGVCGIHDRRLLSIVDGDKLKRIMQKMLDETEFLSPHGIRALSRVHKEHPYILNLEGVEHRVDYEPGESSTYLFGGNSNWRGPIWFPMNFLLIESLQKFHRYFGDNCRVECPTGSGVYMNLSEVADEIARRLISIFAQDKQGRRPVFGQQETFQSDPAWSRHIPFYEYFHGDTGAGVGASHQTGWTGLVAKLIQQQRTRDIAAKAKKAPSAQK